MLRLDCLYQKPVTKAEDLSRICLGMTCNGVSVAEVPE